MPRRVAPLRESHETCPGCGSDGLDRVAELVAQSDHRHDLIGLLRRVQDEFGYLPAPVVDEIARCTGVPATRIYGLITFYAQFRLTPVGRHVIDVCMGTACHVAGAPRVVEGLVHELEVAVGGTTADGLFTLQTVNCVGACALAPVVRIGDESHGRLGPNEARKLVRKLRELEVAR